MRINFAIVFVSDMTRSVEFYRDVLGLSLKYETPHWTEFSTEGATLALHASTESDAEEKRHEHGVPGQCRPGLSVQDLDEFHAEMVRNDVLCIQEPTVRFGSRIAQYGDPDGLVISVGETRPEG